jgi:uncharacterized protein (DUF488 family)
MATFYMIGHSNHPLELFKAMLEREKISLLYDIRMIPFSRYVPQYNQTTLPNTLAEWGIEYKYRSDIGPRVEGDTPLYDANGFNYDKALNRERILEGLKLLVSELNKNDRVVIMATKKEPLECHRFLILSRVLQNMGHTIQHILPEETVATEVLEKRLVDTLERRIKRGTVDAPENYDPLEFAYFAQAEKVAKMGMKKYKNLKKKKVV